MPQNHQDEIDLGYLFGKISGFFRSLVKLLYAVFSFFIKYSIVIVVLIVVGVGIGYYLDRTKTEVYNNELILVPNFESTQYLYDKVEALNSKLRDGDIEFLEKTFGQNYSDLRGLEAEPIVDVFTYASESRETVDLFKILTDKQDIPEYVNDPQNFQYYKFQHVTIKIKGKEHSKEIVDKVISYFNDNDHFKQYQKVSPTEFTIANFEKTISQIDTILKAAATNEKTKGTSPSILVNDNSQLNDLISSKERLTLKLADLYIKKIDEQEIVKVAAINYNVTDFSGIYISNKLKYPLLLVLLFSGFFFLRFLFTKMKQIAEKDAE